MTEGTICVILCPMLEDELIYSLSNDPEEKRVYVADVPPAVTLLPKLSEKGIPYTLVDEQDFLNWTFLPEEKGYNIAIFCNNLGLHAEPKDLKTMIEEQALFLGNKADVLAFYYGLCGNAMWKLKEWAEKQVSSKVFTFTDCDGLVCDDCIGVAVGGQKRYIELLKTHTGRLLLTPAFAGNWEEFLSASEMMRGIDTSEKETMKLIFQLCGYEYAVMLQSPYVDLDKFKKECEEVCNQMELKLIDGGDSWADLTPAKKLYSDAKNALTTSNS